MLSSPQSLIVYVFVGYMSLATVAIVVANYVELSYMSPHGRGHHSSTCVPDYYYRLAN